LRFGATHPGGFNAVFTDGSTRKILYTVTPTVFASLGAIGDGASVNSEN
jgi:prepilin-type processing-associated H-X9-DG protein